MALRGDALTGLKLGFVEGVGAVIAGLSQVAKTDFGRDFDAASDLRLVVLL